MNDLTWSKLTPIRKLLWAVYVIDARVVTFYHMGDTLHDRQYKLVAWNPVTWLLVALAIVWFILDKIIFQAIPEAIEEARGLFRWH